MESIDPVSEIVEALRAARAEDTVGLALNERHTGGGLPPWTRVDAIDAIARGAFRAVVMLCDVASEQRAELARQQSLLEELQARVERLEGQGFA